MKDFVPSSNHWICDLPLTMAWVISSECPGPMPWLLGMGNESKAWTRVDSVCSKTFHGAGGRALDQDLAVGGRSRVLPLIGGGEEASRMSGERHDLVVVRHPGPGVRR